ncbi:MAG: efflux RND transporter periplasmic adaptor subunit [Bacteroidetes bacterium]|nr:efflux RND transporter periplasmic adaptor subunit [Bacteroidota bacterium]
MIQRFLAIFIVATTLASCKRSASTTMAVRKDLTQAVYASGKIYPLNDYKVISKLPGYIERIHVSVGDSVKIGQALVTIKSEVSTLNVDVAKNQLQLAEQNAGDNSPLLMALKQDVVAARSKYELDSANYTRYTNLLKDNAASKAQFDQSKTQFEISKQLFLKAANNYMTTRDRVRTEYGNAKLQYEAQLSNKSDYIIASLVNGKVYDIIPKEGELVSSQNVIMEVGDISNYEVELSVDEMDISLLKKGQDIVYVIDAYKELTLRGKVMEAYPRINQVNKTSKIVASIELPGSVNVYSGMSVEGNIIIAEKKNALVIPREFLIDSRKVKINSSGELREIKKGAEDLQFVEVLEGLDESTEIVKP